MYMVMLLAEEVTETMAVEQLNRFRYDIPNRCFYAHGTFQDFMLQQGVLDDDYHHRNSVVMIGNIVAYCLVNEERASRFLSFLEERFVYLYRDIEEREPLGHPGELATRFH